MKPVWIKYYGLIPMTKMGYLIATAVAGLFAAAALAVLLALGQAPPFHWPWEPVPRPGLPGLGPWLYNHLYEVLLVLFILEGIDLVLTLRRFAEKEAEQRAQLSDPTPQP
jgi:hypothetical protein